MINYKKHKTTKGFSLIELLVVIVVVGILIIITVVGFPGVIKDTVNSSVVDDLDSVSKQLKSYQALTATDGKYPIRIDDCPTPAAGNLCIKASGSNKLSYTPNNNSSPKNFRITVYNEDYGFYYSNDANDIKCPLNFVIVPGSSLYGTKDFCAMKYEAKQASPIVPISKPDGLPWVNVPQELGGVNNDANDYSKNVANCNGCHLISEAEWMTIAQNALSNPLNWSSGVVGTGYIYSGHNDSAPNNALSANSNDSNGYSGETNTGGNQRRTLVLSNGEVIWDLAGNVCEWTSGQVSGAGNQPGIEGGDYAIRQWTEVTYSGNLSINPSPTGTGLMGANNWNSSYGIGKIASSTIDSSLRGFGRGSWWGAGSFVGILTIEFEDPVEVDYRAGFRAAR